MVTSTLIDFRPMENKDCAPNSGRKWPKITGWVAASALLIAMPHLARGQEPENFVSGGLTSYGGTATVNGEGDRLSVSYYIKNQSKSTFRLFLFESPNAVDNGGNVWEPYNAQDTRGIWYCGDGDDCMDDQEKKVEEKANILGPGDTINIVIPMKIKSGKARSFGDVVSVGLTASVQEIYIEETATGKKIIAGPWNTRSLGKPDIPLKQQK